MIGYNLKELGIRMKNIRKVFNLEQKESTHRLGLYLTTLSGIEIVKSRPGYVVLFNLGFLGLNLTCFLFGRGEAFPPYPCIYSKGSNSYKEYTSDMEGQLCL